MKTRPKHISGRNKFEYMPMTIPRFSDEETDDLLIHVLRLPSVFESAMPYFVKMPLDSICDLRQVSLLYVLREFYTEQTTSPRDKSFEQQVRHALRSFGSKPEFTSLYEEYVEELLDEEDGLIARAFRRPRRDYDTKFGHKLLRRFLVQHIVIDQLRAVLHGADEPKYFAEILNDCRERFERLQFLDASPPQTLGVLWEDHESQLLSLRGREFIGLKSGIAELDRRTQGLRGLTVFGAKPGAGKTTFALNVATGVCRHARQNDCAVVILSLDMYKFDVLSRIRCMLADVPWQTLVRGSFDESSRLPDSLFSQADQTKLDRANELVQTYELDKRLTIVDREDIGDDTSAERLRAILQEAKHKAGASRGLIVIDYLQLLSVPDDMNDGGDLGADKYRIRLVQRVLEGSRGDDSPLGDTAIVISESRKPPSSKETWGDSMSELMGSARLGYAADAVILYREMNNKELAANYGIHDSQVVSQREKLRQNGVSPVTLILEKGRDGMTRGVWPMEFHFRTSAFQELRGPVNTTRADSEIRTRYSLDRDGQSESAELASQPKTRRRSK